MVKKNKVEIDSDIYPQPVIGLKNASFYNGGINTSGGNPNALMNVRDELLDRVFDKSGDLYEKGFASKRSTAEFQSIAVIYQGVGAAGLIFISPKDERLGENPVYQIEDEGPPLFLVSDSYLFDRNFEKFGVTTFAHEFGHTLGLDDEFKVTLNPATEWVIRDDIMGSGRNRPLDATYLSLESKKLLGLDY